MVPVASLPEMSPAPARPRARQSPRPGSGRRRRLAGLAVLAGVCALAATRTALPSLRCFAGSTALDGAAARARRLVLRAAAGEAEIREEVGSLRAREIKRELEALGVDAADAFDKEELVERLVQARLRGDAPPVEEAAAPSAAPSGAEGAAAAASAADAAAEPAAAPEASPTAADTSSAGGAAVSQEILERCRSMRVKELRTELGSRGISWADALEKEELVQRFAGVLAEEGSFSLSARLRPGVVGELTGAELQQELQPSGTPLLLDVYAAWCGPCQMMAPHLQAAARQLGARARVAKMDSDQEPGMASQLRVGGLPTIIVFDRSGKEVARQEGAIMEQQLVDMVVRAGG
mmetsp:Transcript_17439/g.52683  ORF Transcript_17439/g.52683 Transcript_17439/m.52683 type:complete len:350 (+) Transcript_17439:61-1110(+)